ncbi:MCP methyltransferase, CheR-type [Desulfamplus magnetovallimortis]|uniref:protein-glutamate O-methyltransferase n=1 Tax=Desulfamplus magnetovallimortis TaxID=1246637 RepID=A0A1W1HC77_9BACT|nr:protein-glutamate O-methyltransferase CheR [Desulfamplus magnetovallimortis]SLM30036.1 MCP methyltransferase, CheR-type [Desulfamplus magnetovallimortis]
MSAIDISNKQFKTLANLIYSESGIHIHDGKMELLKSKIAKRMRATRISSCSSYLEYLIDNKDEIIEFIDTVTTNHSFFFRENRSIENMIRFLTDRGSMTGKGNASFHGAVGNGVASSFKLWCAACSTGDEPYSVAIQLLERGLDFNILATDISHSVLNVAIKGIYSSERVKNVPVPLLHRYFQKGNGKQSGFVRVKKTVMEHVAFKKFNLVTDAVPQEQYDVVLCRNVMIYFDNATTENVINRLYHALKPGGLFIIGQAESLMNMKHNFKSLKNTPSTFQK